MSVKNALFCRDRNKTFLITGGCGFIGFNFVQHILAVRPNIQFVVLDKITYAANAEAVSLYESHVNITFYRGDICNMELLQDIFATHGITDVMHFAAESHVDSSIHNPDVFIQTNIVGTHCLLQVALKHWQGNTSDHRFHHISTDEVFGMLADEDPPFNENTAYNPSSPYSASKAASDHLVQSYHHTYGLNTVITNCSNNYGPYQHDEKLIPTVIRACLNGSPIPVYGQGLNIRDWLYVHDHCIAIEKAIESAAPGSRYCIGGRCEVRNIDIVHQICKRVDELVQSSAQLREAFPKCPVGALNSCADLIQFVQDRPGHDWRYAIDDARFEKEIGKIDRHTLQAGLAKTVAFYVEKYKKS